jgi:hypothetical protein
MHHRFFRLTIQQQLFLKLTYQRVTLKVTIYISLQGSTNNDQPIQSFLKSSMGIVHCIEFITGTLFCANFQFQILYSCNF